MASLKDLHRLANGFSLVTKEAIRRLYQGMELDNPNLHSLVKKVLLAAADRSGLTKGLVRDFSVPTSSLRDRSDGSVKYVEEEEMPTPLNQTQAAHQLLSPDLTLVQPPSAYAGKIQGKDAAVFDSQRISPVDEKADAAAFNDTYGEKAVEVSPSPLPLQKKQRRPRERKVPSTPLSRALGFAGLGASLAWGTLQESARRLVFGTSNLQEKQSALSPVLSEGNAERLALALCRMRGAALKLGQMLSIQDESLVPAPILAALDIVRQGADMMPRSQLNHMLDTELGHRWSAKLASFDYVPMAAASIGQVHRVITNDGLQAAMKIQYPGVANSIESDIENVKLLLDYTRLIPKNLYLDKAMKVAKEELSRECDYELEAANQKKFRELLSNIEGFYVPEVVDDLSSKRVLTTELVPGVPIDKVALLDQVTRDYVGKKLLELTLLELFTFRFMQTDPNWSNFLYDDATRLINLIDFGAARHYPKHFVDDYLRMVVACANSDREAVIERSQRLGFLTGQESEIMLEAHVQAAFVVGLPFSKPGGYDFRSSNITQSLSNIGATMLRHRLTPPPDEIYSLHRKLAGAFLACIKLGAVVPCRELLLQVHERYQFGEVSSSFS